jgi:hypothetical protein
MEEEIDKCDWIDKNGVKCGNKEHGIIVVGDIFGPTSVSYIPYCKKHEPFAIRICKEHNSMNLLIAQNYEGEQ